ncbi:MAG: hypothetical protein IKO41_13760 [Lachnospiraceae bacterium]|nr:hypothetical protein [Lachnospiraceae bacterium]
MSNLAGFIFILFLIAAVIIIVGVLAYNKRLDRITKGEVHDTHTRIPEPGTTAGITYKIVLMVLAVFAVLSISTANGLISSLNSSINNLKSEQNMLNREITQLRYQLEQNDRIASTTYWNIPEQNLETQTVKVQFTAELKQYSDNTSLALSHGNTEIPLKKTAPGVFSGDFTANLFEDFADMKLCITENGVTKIETTDFPQYLFWDILPMPSLQCTFDSSVTLDKKLKYSGSYMLMTSAQDQIEKATVTYMTDGKDLKTLDITKEAKALEQITLEKGLDLEKDLTFRIELTTKDGYKVVEQTTVIYETSYDSDDEYLRIFDKDGKLIWEDSYK